MAAPFQVVTTPAFDRLAKGLAKGHPEFPGILAKAVATLALNTLNVRRERQVRKLVGAAPGQGQYRLRIGRWRFRYDVDGRNVVLHYAGLRREETYRETA
jgi:mRNA-degrading endonuclease RelE of RelBE toxin-antitoxin system